MGMRNVLVTGGSNGIGRATVLRFARAGERVWFTYCLGRSRAEQVVAMLRDEGISAVDALEFDQGDWASHERLAEALPDGVDVLVNNAAVGSATVANYAESGEPQRDRAMLEINALGPLWLTQRFLPGMLERGYGKIVNIASVGGGIAPFPGFRHADGMSKAALAFLTRQLAAELAHDPIDLFALCPGAVRTDMFQASTLGHLTPEGLEHLLGRLPRGRLIEPEEIADVVWWLCEEQATVLRGAVIDASMGLGVHPGLMTGYELEHEGAGPSVPAPAGRRA